VVAVSFERHRRRLEKAHRLIVVREQQLDFVAHGLVAVAHLGEVRGAGVQRQRPRALERLFETRPGFAGEGHVPWILTGRGLVRCRQSLMEPGLGHRPVALHCGG